jgi:hypothetical protein
MPWNLGVGVTALANAITIMKVLSSINLGSNNLGALALPDGWKDRGPGVTGRYQDPSGDNHQEPHTGSTPEGAIALDNAIKDMQAGSLLSKLDLRDNQIPPEEAAALEITCKDKAIELELDTRS